MFDQLFVGTLAAIGMIDGVRRMYLFFKLRNIDTRPFSLERLWFNRGPQNPIEQLITSILSLAASLFLAYIVALSLK